jgi:hypothetical protein
MMRPSFICQNLNWEIEKCAGEGIGSKKSDAKAWQSYWCRSYHLAFSKPFLDIRGCIILNT